MNLKPLLLLLLAGLLARPGAAQHPAGRPGYHLTVDVRRLTPQPKSVRLSYYYVTSSGLGDKTSTAPVVAGKATFSGAVAEPAAARVEIKQFGPAGRFILSNHPLQLTAGRSIEQLAIAGSPYQKDYAALLKKQEGYQQKAVRVGDRYAEAMRANQGELAGQLNSEEQQVHRELADSVYRAYVVTHAKTSPLSVFALHEYQTRYLQEGGPADLGSLCAQLAPAYQRLPTAVLIRQFLRRQQALVVGGLAPAFTQPDSTGKPVALSDYRGKYVLVDFWASWCHPCRAESPYLIEAYHQFHGRNFDILSVSFDDARQRLAWLRAIRDDKVGAWTQVCDLKGIGRSPVAELYGIQAIPQNYLLDPSGKIIATNLRGEELQRKLAEVLGPL